MATWEARTEGSASTRAPWTSARAASRALVAGFPMLIYAAFAQYTLNMAQTRAHPALPAATALFPLVPLVLYLYARLGPVPGRRRPGTAFVLACLALAAWMAAAFVATPMGRLPAAQLVRVQEAGTYSVYALLALHCWLTRGRGDTVIFFGVATLYGFVLESSGVSLGFFSERGYDQYLPFLAAPLVTMLGWSNVFYPCVTMVEALQRRWPRLARGALSRAVLVTAIGLALDLHLDPLATRLGFWRWNPLLHPVFLGVPAVNFVAWFYALLGFGAVYYLVARAAWTPLRTFVLLPASLCMALVAEGGLMLATMAVLEGTAGPSLSIVRAYLRAHHLL